MKYRIPLFLILNFWILWLSMSFVWDGISSDWYKNLNHAPWSPPSWFFGVAWTILMTCFSIFMAYAWWKVQNKKRLTILYVSQAILNISWSPTYFSAQMVWLALLIISSLTLFMIYFLFSYKKELGRYSYLVLPYILWLTTAVSLNAYVLLKN